MPDVHARYFQASGSVRWIPCPGSVMLCDGLPDQSSSYAEEGTLAHTIAAELLKDGATVDTDELSEDLFQATIDYVNYVKELAAGKLLFVEHRVDFSEALGQEDGSGTADAIIVGEEEIKIVDLKTGRNPAFALPQLGLYAVGALEAFDHLGPFKQVRLVIHQSRIGHVDEVVLTLEELEAFMATARAAAADAMSDNPTFQPGEKQCRFCKAKASCPALLAQVHEVTTGQFEDLDALPMTTSDLKAISPETLGRMFERVELVEAWCKAIREAVFNELKEGREVPGFKLVEGKRGARQWSDEAQAEAALKSMRLKVEEMYDLKLISPTSAEKRMKAGILGPRQWAKLKDLITQAGGKATVAPANDKRPAITIAASPTDFDLIEN